MIDQTTGEERPEETFLDIEAERPKRGSRVGYAVALVLALLLAVAGGAVLASGLLQGWGVPALMFGSADTSALLARIEVLEQKTQTLEAQLAQLVPTNAETPADQTSAAGGPDAEDLAKLKAGLAGLAGALDVLQAQLQKSSQATADVRETAQTGLASVVAFLQMQQMAATGRPFETERQALRTAAEGDQILVDAVVKLEPFALSGVPDIAALQKAWGRLAAETQAALRKASAKTWQDRIIVALENLVSIRALNPAPGSTLSFASIDLDLQQGRLQEAVDKVAALPPEALAALADWRAKAESRLDLDREMKAIADHMIARGAEQTQPDSAVGLTPPQMPAASPEGKTP